MHKKKHRADKKTDTPNGKRVLCQRTFNSVFRAVFFTQFNLGYMGPFRHYCILLYRRNFRLISFMYQVTPLTWLLWVKI